MSETLASMQEKIKSSDDLHLVVKAMKATAAANIGQYQRSALALKDYYRTVEIALALCLKKLGAQAASSVLPQDSTQQLSGRAVMVVFGSDQGLVGRFNDAIAEDALKTFATLPLPREMWAVGGRVRECLESVGSTIKGSFEVPSSVRSIEPLVSRMLTATDPTLLYLVSNQTIHGSVSSPVTQRLLPLDRKWIDGILASSWPNRHLAEVQGNASETLQALVHEYLFVSIFKACAGSLESENATRLAAMQRADKSIDSLVQDLTTKFHRVRQSRIDEELFDVIAGYNALGEQELTH